MAVNDTSPNAPVFDTDPVAVLFLDGLERVARVIDHNCDYDAIIGHKLTDEFRSRFSPSNSLEERRKAALSEWANTIIRSKKATYALPDVDLLFLGRTKNNLREFAFFLDIVGTLGKKFSHFNAVDLKLSKAQHSEEDLNRLLERVMPKMVDYIESRQTVGPELVYQIGQFAVHFARYYFSLSRTDSKHPLLAIVANDHSPNPVAFSLAMKAFGIPRLYIQHAEVSDGFPPLDFEYSILRNEVSRRIYAGIAPIAGDVFVISRLSGSFIHPKDLGHETARPSVVLYTTGRVEMDGLRRVFERLKENPDVSSIYVKPHPNQAPIEWPSDLPVLEASPDFSHIAVVANSSVVIELLHRGLPVFQNFDFDPVPADYYGFVRNRIAGPAPMETLGTPFWEKFSFDQLWYSRYADLYAPPQSASDKDKGKLLTSIRHLLERRRRPRLGEIKKVDAPKPVRRPTVKLPEFGQSIVRVAAQVAPRMVLETVKYVAYKSPLKNSQAMRELRTADAHLERPKLTPLPDAQKLEWLKFSIAEAQSPAAWLQRTLQIGLLTEEEVIKCIGQLYLVRHPVVFTLFDHVDHVEDNLPVYLWLAFKRFEITGVALPYPLEGMIDAVFDVPNHRFVRSSLEGLVFNACLRENRLDLLDLLFEKGLRVRRESLSTTRRIALLRHLIESGEVSKYEKTREEFWQAETPFHRLKIADLDNVFGTKHSGSTHHDTEMAFEHTAPPPITAEFKAAIKPVYVHVRTSMRFMDVRSNAEERNHFQRLVMESLQQKKPFSMIRLSDGEGYAFAEGHEYFSVEDQLNRERHWWGIELDQSLRSAITARIRTAVDQADALGIPSIHRFVRDVHEKSASFKANVQGRGLLQVLHYFSGRQQTALFGDEKMNIPLFRSHDPVREMMSASENCVLVSSANLEHLPNWMNGLTNISHVTIPTHFRTSRNGKYHVSEKPLPLVYQAIDEEVRSKTSPGTLVLVAGGIVGKIFIGTAKEEGGVALDLGSVMDDWLAAGIHSLH